MGKKTIEKSIDDNLIPEHDGGLVSMEEAITMKALKLQGLSNLAISKKVKRGSHTIGKVLKEFENMLPEDVDMNNRVIDRFEELTERHLQNAEKICQQADEEVSKKISLAETTAVDAARIRQIYGNILNSRLGGVSLGDDEEGGKSPAVVTFINTVINIQEKQKNDRSTTTTRAEGNDGQDESRAKEECVEGIVS